MLTIAMTAAFLGVLASANVQAAEQGLAEAIVTRPPLKQEINRLLIADAVKAALAWPALPAATADSEEGVIQLVPLTVKGLPDRKIKPVSETRVEKFVRTGVLWQSSGPNPRVRLWMKGDRGLMISFGF